MTKREKLVRDAIDNIRFIASKPFTEREEQQLEIVLLRFFVDMNNTRWLSDEST